MRTCYLMIDYENVQPTLLSRVTQENIQVIVFVGAAQTKIGVEVATALQAMGARARYVQVSGSGTNTLDFHIAFYIGQLAAQEPEATFQIISKDTGFDPLIAHLKSRGIAACRLPDVGGMAKPVAVPKVPTPKDTQITPVKAAPKPPVTPALSAQAAAIVAYLKQHEKNRPATVKTLSNAINHVHKKTLTDAAISTIVQALQKQGHVRINGTKVSYPS